MIDYKTLTIFLLYCFLLFKFISFFSLDFIYKVYICINGIMPFVVFILLNIREECVIDKLVIIIKFLLKRKKYINWKYYAKLNTIYVKNEEKYHIVKLKIK